MLYRLRSIDKILLYRYQEINLAILLSIVLLLCACQTNASRIEETKKSSTSGIGILRPAAERLLGQTASSPIPPNASSPSTSATNQTSLEPTAKDKNFTKGDDDYSRPLRIHGKDMRQESADHSEQRKTPLRPPKKRDLMLEGALYFQGMLEEDARLEECKRPSRQNDEDCIRLRKRYQVAVTGAPIKPSAPPNKLERPCRSNCPKSGVSEPQPKAAP
jgi:hypothetical protein